MLISGLAKPTSSKDLVLCSAFYLLLSLIFPIYRVLYIMLYKCYIGAWKVLYKCLIDLSSSTLLSQVRTLLWAIFSLYATVWPFFKEKNMATRRKKKKTPNSFKCLVLSWFEVVLLGLQIQPIGHLCLSGIRVTTIALNK